MAKKSHGLAARVFALEKTIAGIFAGKKTKGKRSKKTSIKKAPKRTKKKTTKVLNPKATKKNKRNTSKSWVAPPTMEHLVTGGEPLFVTPIKSE